MPAAPRRPYRDPMTASQEADSTGSGPNGVEAVVRRYFAAVATEFELTRHAALLCDGDSVGVPHRRLVAVAGTADVLLNVSGMLAEGDAGAHTILEDARSRFPRSRRLENLEAVVAYRETRLPDAERILARLVREDPRDPVATFNRALLLRETGRDGEAALLEAALRDILPEDAPLRARLR